MSDTPRTDFVANALAWAKGAKDKIVQLERELAAIKSQPVPVEPEYPSPQYAQIIQFEGCPSVVISPETYEEITAYIDTLKQQLQVAQQERDGYLDLNRDCAELALNHLERELAEATVKESLIAQRLWVGLTDREFQPMIQKAMAYYGYDQSEPSHLTVGAGFRVFANAIEAKLREKNS